MRVAPTEPLAGHSGGWPLAPVLRRRLEGAFGADFSAVRLHTGPEAHGEASRFGARAFAVGSHIYLGSGQSADDLRLVAHEAAHTLQQSAEQNAAYPQGPPRTASATDLTPAPAGMIQRDQASDAATAEDADGGLLSFDFWSLVSTVAPRWLVDALREIKQVGFWGFLKGRITGALNGLFDRLKQSGGTTARVVTLFTSLLEKGKTIYAALAAGNCEPLFQAVRDLGDALGKMAGDAWDKITDFLKPVGDFLSDLWQKFGAPVVDFLKTFAADTWDFIKDLGQKAWDAIKGLGALAGMAWDKVKDLLGISSGADDGGGLVDWIKGKAGEIWDGIKEELKPVVEPIKRVASRINELLPLQAILNLRDQVNDWLDKATAMADHMDEEGDVAANQDLLRDIVLPGIKRAIASLRGNVTQASQWVTDKIGSLVTTVAGFFESLASNSLLSPLKGAIDWLSAEAIELGDWAAQKVVGLFGLVDRALSKLSDWVEPVLKMLQKLLDALGNLMSRLGDLVLGPLRLVPRCIRDPIQDFIVKEILGRIPIFRQIVALPEAWAKVQKVFRTIVVQIFRDGDLLAAAWTFFKAILEVFNVPPRLITDLIRNAAKAFKDILRDPIGFLINCVKAASQGLQQFIDNLWTHLLQGLADWLFGQLKDAKITVPKEFSLAGVFDVVMQILGLTLDHIINLIDKKHPGVGKRVRQMIAAGEFVIKWLKVLIEKGPKGLWDEIKTNLSNLWDLVIDKVKGFVIEKIVQKATQWLLGFLDVSGITPAINTIIAIYNAIESFFQYLKEILEILNSVFTGVSDIAKGALARAAGFVENAAARALPIAIGFLANQLGLGKLGEKIKEVVQEIRAKVDGAINKLIDGAANLWASIKDAARKGVQAVVNWWQARKKFANAAGEEHEAYFRGEGLNAQILVESTPKVLADFLATATPKTDDEKKVLAQIKTKATRINNLKAQTKGSFGQAAGEEIRGLFDDIVELLSKLGTTEAPPATKVTWTTQSTLGDTDGVTMVADPLTLDPGGNAGSQPYQESKLWLAVNRRPMTYVRGHLLNHHVHGPGSKANLIPITRTANGQMERKVETTVKKAVLSEKRVVRYEVKAEFGQPKRTYVPEESLLPVRLVLKAVELEKKGNQWKTGASLVDEPIENTLPADTPV